MHAAVLLTSRNRLSCVGPSLRQQCEIVANKWWVQPTTRVSFTAAEVLHQAQVASRQSTGEICKRVVDRYTSLCKAFPFAMSFTICGVKGCLADLFCQTIVERRERVDTKRTLGMTLFSGSYCGMAQHFVFNVAFTKIFGVCTKLPTAISKTVTDAFVHAPLFYLPTYLAYDELMRFGSLSGMPDRIAKDLYGTWSAYMKVWPAVCMGLFTIVPVELRITCLATVSLVWLVVLSAVAH